MSLEASTPGRLAWPDHFPPRDRWKRFFLGVRWLGPDLSFFAALRTTQGQRTIESFASAWSDDERPTALSIGNLLQRHIGWPAPYFLPQDQFAVIAHGPRFQSMDELLFDSFANALDDAIGKVDDQVWEELASADFGTVVATLIKRLPSRS